VASINEALSFLGMSELKTLIIASGIVSAMPKINGLDSAEPLAQTSCSDVACAVHIAEYLSVNKEADDEALMENFPSDVADRIGFTAELLADLVSSSSTSQLSGLAA